MTGVGSIFILLQGFGFPDRNQMEQKMQESMQGDERDSACNVDADSKLFK